MSGGWERQLDTSHRHFVIIRIHTYFLPFLSFVKTSLFIYFRSWGEVVLFCFLLINIRSLASRFFFLLYFLFFFHTDAFLAKKNSHQIQNPDLYMLRLSL
jgi:hypothetical protein